MKNADRGGLVQPLPTWLGTDLIQDRLPRQAVASRRGGASAKRCGRFCLASLSKTVRTIPAGLTSTDWLAVLLLLGGQSWYKGFKMGLAVAHELEALHDRDAFKVLSSVHA